MALQACPDCGHQVSNKAQSCVKCGHPLAAQTIEATGKKWKLMQVVGALLIAVGFTALCASAGTTPNTGEGAVGTTLVLLAGLVLVVSGRFGAWWHHA